MNEYERGKAFAELANKYWKFPGLFFKIGALLWVAFLPVVIFFLISLISKNIDITNDLFFLLVLYLSLLGMVGILISVWELYVIKRVEKENLQKLMRGELDDLLLIAPGLFISRIFDRLLTRLFFSKDFLQGFQDTFWATKIINITNIVFIILILSLSPFILMVMYAFFLSFM